MQNENMNSSEHDAVSNSNSENMGLLDGDFQEATTLNGSTTTAVEDEATDTLEDEGQDFIGQESFNGMESVKILHNNFDSFDEASDFDEGDEDEGILLDALEGSFPEEARRIAEVVIGRDDRRRISNTRRFPNRAICQLTITAQNGRRYVGTGWLVSPRTVITAGHCVYLHGAGGWAKSIEVTPGMNGNSKPFGSCKSSTLRSVKGWVTSKDRSYDYGAIILPNNCRFKRTIGKFDFANYSDRTLLRKYVNICGYPGDKGGKTQWYHAKRMARVNAKQLVYTIDTAGGQSGSPIFYRMRNNKRVAIGIHTSGSQRGNSGTRINASVKKNLIRWRDEGR